MKLGFCRRLRCLLITPFAPGFWKNFPKQDLPGPWIAESLVVTPWSSRVDRSKRVEGGLWQAYIEARDLAVDTDMITPVNQHGEIGVDWGIRRPAEDEESGLDNIIP